MHVTIKSKVHNYDLNFEGKINIVTGKSSSRKTEFVETLMKVKRGIKSIICNIRIGNYKLTKDKIFVYPNGISVANFYKHDLSSVRNCLFVIDESSDMLRNREVSEYIKKSNNYFIIVCRKLIGWLPLSIDSIYEFKREKGCIINQPVYCENNEDLTSIEDVDYIITEDSKSSQLFFKYHFDYEIHPGYYIVDGKKHSMDNSKLHEEIDRLDFSKRILVVFDASAYGFFYALLLGVLKNRKYSILAWDSYENYLLRSPLLGIKLTKADVGCDYNSLEQMSYEIIKKKLAGYGKDRLIEELKDISFIQPPLDKLRTKNHGTSGSEPEIKGME